MANLVIDSGAYSAWNSGKAIDLEEYCDWLEDKHDLLWHYYSLDAIPGRKGQGYAPTRVQIDKASKLGWKNYTRMLDRGLKPVPVFHQFEDYRWLDRIIETEPDLIGISPNKAVPMNDRIQWTNHFFNYVCGGKPYPARKYHGLGISGPRLVYRFPWYSIDTTAPLLGAGRAELAFPFIRFDGTPDWDRALTWVSITERAGGGRKHVSGQSHASLQAIKDYVTSRGEDMSRLPTSRCLRARFNFGVFLEQFSKRPTPAFRAQGFAPLAGPHKGADEPISKHVRVIAAVNTSRCDNSGLTQIGFNDRLISYVFISGWNREKIQRFVTSGIGPPGDGFPDMTEACNHPPNFRITRPRLKT